MRQLTEKDIAPPAQNAQQDPNSHLERLEGAPYVLRLIQNVVIEFLRSPQSARITRIVVIGLLMGLVTCVGQRV